MTVVEMAMMAGVTYGKLADAILTPSEGSGIFLDLPRPSLQRSRHEEPRRCPLLNEQLP
jgi:hypothetical protein